MSGKTVLIFGSYAPSLVQFRGALIAAVAERGHKVFAAAPAISDKVATELKALGAEPREVPVANASINPFSMLRSLAEVKRMVHAIKPDVMISYTVNLPISP
jgi:hypothetical protein